METMGLLWVSRLLAAGVLAFIVAGGLGLWIGSVL